MNKDDLKKYREMQMEIRTMETRLHSKQKKLDSPRYKQLLLELNKTDNLDNADKSLKLLLNDIEENCNKINRLISERKNRNEELERKLEELDPLDRTVITLYYIDCMNKYGEVNTWNDVADAISYSLRRTQDIHKRALEKISSI